MKLQKSDDRIFQFIKNAIILLMITLVANSCDKAVNPPIDNNEEYTWTVDTLRNPNGYGVVPWSIWGGSPKDVWVAGFNLAGQGEIFHLVSNKWNRVTPELGFNYEVSSVYGFAENDVYVIGFRIILGTTLHTESLILHYNGTSIQQEIIPNKSSALLYIHGRNSSDIWACGNFGTLYHKTGADWQKIPFDTTLNLGPIYNAPDGSVYMMSFPSKNPANGDSAKHFFWKYSNQTWQKVDSNYVYNDDYILLGYTFGNTAMWGINESKIYSAGYGLYEYDGKKWLYQARDDYSLLDIKGTSSDNIYAVGYHGIIIHFDGIQWTSLRDFHEYTVSFYSVMPFEDEIFITAYQNEEGFVVRKKLK